MSRIGRMPIPIPDGVEVKIDGTAVTVKGPKGTLNRELHPRPKLEIVDGQIIVTRPSESRQDKSLHGLTRSLVANMVEGVTKGYEKELEIIGLGYRVEADGKGLILNVGYSHSVKIAPIGGIDFEVQSDRQRNAIKVKGIDKEVVGFVAAEIRRVKPPEPYKGKGIRYVGEYVRRKVGKAGV
ncbi:MAG: 50S ribosomal protein L6 [Nitrospinota bacterium]|nr:50S ribosomal protein L6 [Nitrospinota bacterium]MDP7167885.1 50S ribosomal protein L6 [Nitrospinota bacterium]MDP7371079.1 50S ribosomal protein L6 [Nitrospinota bacterium]MDP7663288.1 50S ribosomal protein L6 [Nitrospinota bacterium]HJP14683.1 50S ribosomal protein L6 [Nitrospinota bacterium]